MMSFCRFGLLVVLLLLAPSQFQAARAQESLIPDFTKGDKIPAGSKHDWNLGPTGARGWIYSNKLETTEARQILITEVELGSPAFGKLKQGDVIVGVDGKEFSYDPRTEFGKAITTAESNRGTLKLLRWNQGKRKGNVESVVIRLTVLGKYSPTAPFDCKKSKQIFEQGCNALAERMRANPNERNGITRSLNVLALLSSGRKEFLPLIREQVSWAAKYSDVSGKSLNSWYYGPINMLVAEYTLATGDKTFLPDLKRISMEIVNGQSAVGSWGHRFALPNGRLKGYGMMNAPGLPLTVSLILARKAGVSDPALDEAIEKSTRLMRFYVGKGCVPYGDHSPWMETHDDNGKNGIAALMFNLLGDEEATQYFSQMSAASHSGEREMGHTGNFFNMLWAMPGVAISGPQASGAWMKEFGWYYDLARRWDGKYQHQGPAQARPDSYNKWDATGAYLLAYAQPLKRLYITGKKDDVVQPVSRVQADSLVACGRGYSHRLKNDVYSDRSAKQLLDSLTSWSPVVRERAAIALSKKDGAFIRPIIGLLTAPKSDLYSRLGACQALAHMKNRAAPAVPALRKTLKADDLWLRVKAAEALAKVGGTAKAAAPELLTMLAETNPELDPRSMQQRYLCFALFDKRNGLLKKSLDGIDRNALFIAVQAGLKNEDGRARGTFASVYKNLSYNEIEQLLPLIHRAVVEPAPSGVMFADEIRLVGLEVLAKHRIKEGLPLCLELIEADRWGQGRRLPRCLKTLQIYGGSAKGLLPRVNQIKETLLAHPKPETQKEKIQLVDETIKAISSDLNPPELRSLRKSG